MKKRKRQDLPQRLDVLPSSNGFVLSSYLRGLEIAAHFREWENTISSRTHAREELERCQRNLPSLSKVAFEAGISAAISCSI